MQSHVQHVLWIQFHSASGRYLPSSSKGSTWFSLSITVNEMFPSHNTAANIANTLCWSSLLMWTTSRASWKFKSHIKFIYTGTHVSTVKQKIIFNKLWNRRRYHYYTKLFSIINPSNWTATALVEILILTRTLQIQHLCNSKWNEWWYGKRKVIQLDDLTNIVVRINRKLKRINLRKWTFNILHVFAIVAYGRPEDRKFTIYTTSKTKYLDQVP